MSKVHAIRRQIKSVKNINQITSAMEMVAASKLRRAQEATLRSRLYATAARELLSQLRTSASPAAHPLFGLSGRPAGGPKTSGRRLIILFTSDRGLAGAYNSNVLRALLPLLPAKLLVIGQRGAQFVSRLPADSASVLGVYPNWSHELAATELRPVVQTALTLYQAGEVDEVSVVFTEYISSIKQVVTRRVLLPIDPAFAKAPAGEARFKGEEAGEEGLFEPSPQAVLEYVVPRFLEVQVYQAHLEALASEHSMRMVAMKNASDNASDLTDDLTLVYNGARQAAITQELAEITAGAEAIS